MTADRKVMTKREYLKLVVSSSMVRHGGRLYLLDAE